MSGINVWILRGSVLDCVSIISMQKRNAKVIPTPCYLDLRKTGRFILALYSVVILTNALFSFLYLVMKFRGRCFETSYFTFASFFVIIAVFRKELYCQKPLCFFSTFQKCRKRSSGFTVFFKNLSV